MAYGQLGAVFQHLRWLLGTQEAADLTDAQLLARFSASRDETAFAALLQRHGPLVLNVCRRVLGNVHDADDAFQAVFLVLARKADSIRRKESLGSWLYGVAFRIASRLKANAARRRNVERQAEPMTPATADHRAAWDDLQPILDEELSRLPEKYRVSIVLRYLQGKSNEEAAREAGCPAGTMSWRLAHGLDLLRQRLDRRGVAIPACGLAVLLTDHAASASLSPVLAAGTLQAAVGFAAGQTAGVSLSILALAEGALKAMFLTKLKLTLVLLLAVGLAGIGAGWVSWNLLGQGTPTALAVPLPEPKPAPPRNPEDKAVSEPVIANEAAFRLETNAVWWLPPVDGQRAIPLALRIENRGKEARQFSRWRGNVVLLAADGTPLQHSSHSSRGVRRVFETDALEQGKQLTAAEPVQLNRRDWTKAPSLRWIDITDTPSAFHDLKPGKYRVALQYTIRNGAAGQWTGDVTTKPVEIEFREAPSQAVDGLELMLTADKAETALKADGSTAEPVKLKLTFTNVSGKPLKLNTYGVQTWGFYGNFLRVIGPDGKEVARSPQPPAPPAGPRAEQFPTLQPGSSWQYTLSFPNPVFRLNATGEYRIRAGYVGNEAATPHPSPAFAKDSWAGKLDSNEVVLKVKPAGNAAAGKEVNGLKLSLSADRTETAMKPDGSNAEPVKLTLTFINVSDQPIKLDAYLPRMKFEVTSPDPKMLRTKGAQEYSPAAGFGRNATLIQPGQSWSWSEKVLPFPGWLEGGNATRFEYLVQQPGVCRLKCSYTSGNNEPAGNWTGTLTSNELALTVKPAGNANAGKEVNGLQLTLSADRTETNMRADGSNAEPVKFLLTFTNVGDQPLKLDTYDFVWRHLQLQLTGPDAESIGVSRRAVEWTKRGPIAADYPTLQPQQQWKATASITLPGEVAIFDRTHPGSYYQQFTFRKAGQYRVQLTYASKESPNQPLAKDALTGALASNEVVLTVQPAK